MNPPMIAIPRILSSISCFFSSTKDSNKTSAVAARISDLDLITMISTAIAMRRKLLLDRPSWSAESNKRSMMI